MLRLCIVKKRVHSVIILVAGCCGCDTRDMGPSGACRGRCRSFRPTPFRTYVVHVVCYRSRNRFCGWPSYDVGALYPAMVTCEGMCLVKFVVAILIPLITA